MGAPVSLALKPQSRRRVPMAGGVVPIIWREPSATIVASSQMPRRTIGLLRDQRSEISEPS